MKKTIKKSKNIIQNTKKNITDAACQLFSKFSYLGVSMSDIAASLNITKAALYYHFSGKKEIYKKVLDSIFNDLSSSIAQALNENTIDKKLRKLIKNYLNFGLKEKNFIRALILKLSPSDKQITKHIAQSRKRITALIQPVIEEALRSKKLTKKIDANLLTSLFIGIMDGLLLEYSFLNKKINLAKIPDQIIAIFFS